MWFVASHWKSLITPYSLATPVSCPFHNQLLINSTLVESCCCYGSERVVGLESCKPAASHILEIDFVKVLCPRGFAVDQQFSVGYFTGCKLSGQSRIFLKKTYKASFWTICICMMYHYFFLNFSSFKAAWSYSLINPQYIVNILSLPHFQ